MGQSIDPSTWMWAEAVELLDRAERLHRQFFRPARGGGARPSWAPPVDVFEDGDALTVVAALPGVEPGALEVDIVDGVLRVAGERTPPGVRAGTIHRLEVPHGRFERRVALPPGAYAVARQELVAGCLVLSLTRAG
ncbi:Hsp20/alpha crystallin family protein [Azospirillum sp.]|uniref:Hsp20/alpha crystallin family protein n=1 Tax=Azospirillum sp. TaxID=34012 RepID=UPI003D71BE35